MDFVLVVFFFWIFTAIIRISKLQLNCLCSVGIELGFEYRFAPSSACLTATHCNILQHTAAHCSTLQHIAAHCNTLQHTATHCNTLQHTAAHYSTLQHTTAPCSTLQHTAAHCNRLQHTDIQRRPHSCNLQLYKMFFSCYIFFLDIYQPSSAYLAPGRSRNHGSCNFLFPASSSKAVGQDCARCSVAVLFCFTKMGFVMILQNQCGSELTFEEL